MGWIIWIKSATLSIEMFKELIDIDTDSFLDILLNAENLVEFLIGVMSNIIDQFTGLVPKEAAMELYHLLESLIELGSYLGVTGRSHGIWYSTEPNVFKSSKI